ncbi:MAG: glycoside hydrolase family 97 protein [Bacteroidia bacterium]|nr:glycoside hydrolase family 97 protein [Bacteroidia bacterium]
MKKNTLLLFVLLCCSVHSFSQKGYLLLSPDGKIQLSVQVDKDTIFYTVQHDKTLIMKASSMSMTLNDAVLGHQPKVLNTTKTSVNRELQAAYYKKKSIPEVYNSLKINFKGNYTLHFRVYNSGLAYRFETSFKNPITVVNEEAMFRFTSNDSTYAAFSNTKPTVPIEQQYFNSFENWYVVKPLSETNANRLILTPVLQQAADGKKMVITEANLFDYPGMFLQKATNNLSLKAVFAPYPKNMVQGGHNDLQFLVKEREKYIAKTEGTRTFPWRIIAVSGEDKELANNDLVYLLADECKVTDVSWIKPGKVAWDWWNDWNISGVDFASGVNNATYKHYIDFASKYSIEYVILDEGWSVTGKADMMQVIPEIDLKELINYGKQKKVGIVLWAGYAAVNKDMEGVCRHYSEMGVKGFKVDFMDRDDQIMVGFYNQLAEVAAKHHLLIDFHGAYKPTGLQRTFPNVINYEGVAGMEQMKWMKEVDQMEYDATLPFIRMVAGPMDYTQGAMRNGVKKNYIPIYTEPMSQGTRSHQLALYTIFESPFNMLCDSPTNYEKEDECTRFIAQIPTVWDQTVVLDGKVGDYIALARQKEGIWYVAAITDWNARDLSLDLSFLDAGNYTVELFRDGANAERIATDFKKETFNLPTDSKLNIHLAPGGGFAAKISKN